MDSKALLVSLLVHGILLGFLWYNFQEIIHPSGEGDYSFVAVSLVNRSGEEAVGPASRLGPYPQGAPRTPSRLSPTTAFHDSTNAIGTKNGGEGGSSEILRQIRSKIERNKFYPLMAKRQNIEGAPVVEFQIQNDGSVKDVQVKQTSGSAMLDEAAIQTVQKAGPYPYYPDSISLSIRYALGGKPH